MTTTPDSHAIRQLAYRLWEQRGRREGHAQDDWFKAERQLLGKGKGAASKRVDEAVKESFPASDAPASGLPDAPPANAEAKWEAAKQSKRTPKPASARKSSPSEKTVAAPPARDTPTKLGSHDAPGG